MFYGLGVLKDSPVKFDQVRAMPKGILKLICMRIGAQAAKIRSKDSR